MRHLGEAKSESFCRVSTAKRRSRVTAATRDSPEETRAQPAEDNLSNDEAITACPLNIDPEQSTGQLTELATTIQINVKLN